MINNAHYPEYADPKYWAPFVVVEPISDIARDSFLAQEF